MRWRTWRDSNPRHPVPKTGCRGGGRPFAAVRQWLCLAGTRHITCERGGGGRVRIPANDKKGCKRDASGRTGRRAVKHPRATGIRSARTEDRRTPSRSWLLECLRGLVASQPRRCAYAGPCRRRWIPLERRLAAVAAPAYEDELLSIRRPDEGSIGPSRRDRQQASVSTGAVRIQHTCA
jgi:hypothetical protein